MNAAVDALIVSMQECLAECREANGKDTIVAGEQILVQAGKVHEAIAELKQSLVRNEITF